MATDPEPKKPRSLAGLSFTTAAPAPVGSLVEVPHVHGPGCDHGHDHDHDAPPVERGPTTRTCSGQSAIQLDLAFFLPGETDDRGRFEQIARELARLPGVVSTHLRRDAAHLEICAHVDPAVAVEVAAVRTVVARASKRYLGKTWFVRGMDSAQCGYVIEHVLRRTPGILSADVAYAAERVVIEYDATVLDEAAIERKVAAVGYELETPSAGHACSHHAHSGGLAPALEMPLTLGAGALLALGFGLPYVLAAPALVPTGLFAVALCLAGFYPARDAIAALRAGRLDIEALMVLAAIGAGALGAWFEGAFLLFLFSLGHTLEHRAMDRARHAVEALAALRPPTAWVRRASGLVETDVAQVVRGDVVVVRPGDRVPLDGTVVAGASQLDQAAITGESVPVPKSVGDGVFAGTVNFDGTLDVRVDKLSTESALARVVDLVAEAEARKSPAQRFTARVERIFVPVVIVGAPLFAVGLWLWGLPVQDAVLRGLSVLVAASPCALAISTPAAVLSAVARAAKGGVLIKGGAHLEALGATRVIAFDKTGTLTVGRPSLVEVVPLALGEAELVALAAGAESLSSHPLAAAIVAAAAARGLTVTAGADVQAVH
ncbi:MAG: cadmium family heavy metal-translocating P-type ATPase, partial [Myxococcota bacterium]